MSGQQTRFPPHKVPQGVSAANQLIKGRDTMDILILIMIPVGVLGILFYLKILTMLGLLGSIGGVLVINYVLFSLIPNEESVLYWVRTIKQYLKTPKSIYKNPITTETIDESVEYNEEETLNRDPTGSNTFEFLETSTDTRELANVEAIDTENGIIHLKDGGYVAGANVSGMERMLTDQDIKKKAENSFRSFLKSIDFDIAIRCTSKEFEIDSEIESYEDRLEDQDVANRPIFKRHLATKKAFIQQEIRALGMNYRQYHVMVSAHPEDQNVGDGGPFEVDFISPDSPVGKWLQKQTGSGKTQEENLTSIVKQRRRSVKRGLSQISDIETSEMDGKELADAIRRFWTNDNTSLENWRPTTPVSVSEEQVKQGSYNV